MRPAGALDPCHKIACFQKLAARKWCFVVASEYDMRLARLIRRAPELQNQVPRLVDAGIRERAPPQGAGA